MKKLLIATTALVGTASVAAADITFSGYGRFGVIHEDDRENSSGDDILDTRLENRYRLNIDSSTETDGGVRFAARIRVQADDNSDNSVDAGSFGGARFQVNVGGLRVRVGNVSGVHDASETINFYGFEPGLIGQIGHYSTFGGGPIDAFTSSSPGGAEGAGGVNGANVKYETGAFAVMASYSEDFDDNQGFKGTGNDYEAWEVGASYTFGDWTIAAAYYDADFGDDNSDSSLDGEDSDGWTASLTGAVGPADIALFIGDSDNEDDELAFGVSGSYPIGASTNIIASFAGGGNDDLDEAFGVGVDHSLGGGVNLKGMVGQQNNKNFIADFGVIFNF